MDSLPDPPPSPTSSAPPSCLRGGVEASSCATQYPPGPERWLGLEQLEETPSTPASETVASP